MKHIWRIFVRDLRNATKNVIGIVVLMGLVIVPAMYAWFNIAASWDPYGNTRNLKVAVANSDKGYKSDLIPVIVNAGNTIEAALRTNKQLDWQFENEKDVIDGVKSGKFYAAIIIPGSFSKDMMTLFSPHATRAKLTYYINEKSNAIAPHITDKGADSIVAQIDSTFTKTLANIALDLAGSLSRYSSNGNLDSYVTNAVNNLNSMADGLDSASNQMAAYSGLLGSSADLIKSAQDLMKQTGQGASSLKDALKNTAASAKSLRSALDTSGSAMEKALDSSEKSLSSLSSQVDALMDGVSGRTGAWRSDLDSLSAAVRDQAGKYTAAADSLQRLRDSIASDASLSAAARSQMTGVLDAQVSQLKSVARDHTDLAKALSDTGTALTTADSAVSTQRARVKKQIADIISSVRRAKKDFNDTVRPQLDQLSSSVSKVFSGLDSINADMSGVTSDISNFSSATSSSIADIRKSLDSGAGNLSRTAARLRAFTAKIANTGVKGLLSQLGSSKNIDASLLASLLAQPVGLERHAVYPMENYGSQMAPFYTVLAIWVGSVILVAMMEAKISDEGKAAALKLKEVPVLVGGKPLRAETPGNMRFLGLHLNEEYFGRYIIFMLLALAQATLICMGDLWFLKIQCENPWQFFAAGWLCAFIFSSLMYALTVAFGAAGKAIAVVLLVMQVAGTGGTFPIQMLPEPFQVIYPLFPFPYAINAMREAIAGPYRANYGIYMAQLSIFALAALFIGVILRRPFILMTTWFTRQVNSTKVY